MRKGDSSSAGNLQGYLCRRACADGTPPALPAASGCRETRFGRCTGRSGGMAWLPREAACSSHSASAPHVGAELRLKMPLCSSFR